MLHPNQPARERILGIGAFGSGKTTAWMSIARRAKDTGSPSRFYVLDSDAAIERMMGPGSQFEDLADIIHVESVFEWPRWESALDEFLGKATPDDWIIVDFIDQSWDSVQEYYVSRIYHQDIEDFFLEARANMKKGTPLDGWKDWSIINRMHRSWMNKLVHNSPAHLYCTAKAEPLRETDDKALQAVFGAHGVRPKGQKHLAHQVHTVLLFQNVGGKEWYLNTIKDRERESLVGTRLVDFAVNYLVGVAGWKL